MKKNMWTGRWTAGVLAIMLAAGSGMSVCAAGSGEFQDAEGGIVFAYGDGTYAQNTWISVNDVNFYVGSDGYVLYGFQTIDGKLYYLPADGIIETGWHEYEGKVCYVTTDGSLAVNTTVEGAVIGADGAAVSPSTEPGTAPYGTLVVMNDTKDQAFYNQVQSIIAACTTDDMTQEEKLRACYDWIINNVSYKRTYETPSGDWTASYAAEVYNTGRGNCYRYAAAFGYLAKALGYDVIVRTGQISAARGGVTPHAWDVITIDGTEYIFDSEMADAEGTPDSYWKKTFDAYPVKPLIGENDWELHF